MIIVYILWALLNIAITIAFFVIFYKGTKLIRERIGLGAAIFFVICFLSFTGRSNDEDNQRKDSTGQTNKWDFRNPALLRQDGTYSIDVVLDKTFIASERMWIQYGKDSSGVNVPISAYATRLGLSSGTTWKPVIISVNPTAQNDRFAYEVYGSRVWKLFNITLYHQPTHYKGMAIVRN